MLRRSLDVLLTGHALTTQPSAAARGCNVIIDRVARGCNVIIDRLVSTRSRILSRGCQRRVMQPRRTQAHLQRTVDSGQRGHAYEVYI
jgi:hypothetical protein